VRVGDIAEVIDSVQERRAASWFNGSRAIVLAIQKQPGSNTVEVVQRIRDLLPEFKRQLPESVSLDILRDQSLAVREAYDDVRFSLLLAVCLVVLVIFLFLRTAAATFIPAVAIPMALLGTFACMYFFNFSLNNLSLLALTLSVGFVVDDAIVMLENIVRRIEQGMPVREAAFKGSREISFTILSMTISLVAVFIPLMFMGGLLGRLLNEFAVTITCSILVSGVVSITLTPMLCSRFLKPHLGPEHARAGLRWMEHFFEWMLSTYRRSLDVCLRHKGLTVSVAGLMVLLTALCFRSLPQGFIPTDDTGQIMITTEGAQDFSFEEMMRHQQAAAVIVGRHPAVEAFMSAAGGGARGGSSSATGRFILRLKPRKDRPHAAIVAAQLRQQLAAVPGIRAYPQLPPSIRIGGLSTRSLYQFSMFGGNLEELYAVSARMEGFIRSLPGVIDVNSDLQITSPQLRVDIDREKAAALGVTPQQIEDSLYNAYGTRQISTIYTPTNQYFVVMEVAPEFQKSDSALSLIHLRTKSGRLVPLDAVASFRRAAGPLTVNHLGQLPAVTLSFNLTQGTSLGDATAAITEIAQRELPGSINYSFVGAAQAFASSLKGMGLLLALAVLVIYIVLGVLYEDFIHPLTILSGLPAAGFGALFTLWLFNEELNLMGYVGVVLLVGIVKKNAIMMVDFAITARTAGESDPTKAIREACLVRFRPIMMTTFAALAAAVPIALGLGAGADSRRPLGLAVVGGLVVSQLLTLFITPAIYIYMEKFMQRFRSKAA